MTTDSSARPFLVTGPAADAFQAFFDMIDAPAALCDPQLAVLTANPAFEILCGSKQLEGQRLHDLLDQCPAEAPDEARSEEVEVVCKTGQTVSLTFSRRGQTVAVVARRLNPTLDSLAAAGRALIEQARVESALLELGRQVAGATSEEELVATVARGVKGLFPGRTFCVRITDPRTVALTSLYAEGRLRDGSRDVLWLKQSAVDKTHLEVRSLPAERVKVATGEVPLVFQGSVRGICAPLAASGQLFGVINVEYPPGLTADLLSDERVLIQLANQVSVAVRNAKLIDELTFVRKYLEELLEHANALILVVNRDRKVVVFNRALSNLTGLTKQEVLGKDLLEFLPDSERLKVTRVVSASLRGEQVSGFETQVVARAGGEVRVAFASSATFTQQGEIEGVIAIGQDLTRMRELERRVVQAEKLASLGQLAASVVHEINNPMTAVSTYADALLKRSLMNPGADQGDVEKFRRINEHAERVLRFTRDLVSYARPASDRAELTDLNQTVERGLGFCEHVVTKHHVTLERQLGPVPQFLAVRQNIIQVLVNLVTNAAHASTDGGRVVVSTRVDGDRALLQVSDNGSGMPPDVLARIFEPFFTTKPDGKGTGLGLSIVQGIVERHGGTIGVESAVGRGTVFSVRLPLVTEDL
ncbi:MAG: PAS domain S-box protein [Myxococcaceae bacterium]|nr:PAS domain S-box protein [Myxococcaceae bacterium]